jgi:hypothetical protein
MPSGHLTSRQADLAASAQGTEAPGPPRSTPNARHDSPGRTGGSPRSSASRAQASQGAGSSRPALPAVTLARHSAPIRTGEIRTQAESRSRAPQAPQIPQEAAATRRKGRLESKLDPQAAWEKSHAMMKEYLHNTEHSQIPGPVTEVQKLCLKALEADAVAAAARAKSEKTGLGEKLRFSFHMDSTVLSPKPGVASDLDPLSNLFFRQPNPECHRSTAFHAPEFSGLWRKDCHPLWVVYRKDLPTRPRSPDPESKSTAHSNKRRFLGLTLSFFLLRIVRIGFARLRA